MTKHNSMSFAKKSRLYLRLAGLVVPMFRARGDREKVQAVMHRVDAVHRELGHGK